jgi:hypothetical protein
LTVPETDNLKCKFYIKKVYSIPKTMILWRPRINHRPLQFCFLRKNNVFFLNEKNEYSQTWVNDHLRITTTCLRIATTILKSQFKSLQPKTTSEQRPPVNNGHKFGVPRLVVVHKFDCIKLGKVKSSSSFSEFLISLKLKKIPVSRLSHWLLTKKGNFN